MKNKWFQNEKGEFKFWGALFFFTLYVVAPAALVMVGSDDTAIRNIGIGLGVILLVPCAIYGFMAMALTTFLLWRVLPFIYLILLLGYMLTLGSGDGACPHGFKSC